MLNLRPTAAIGVAIGITSIAADAADALGYVLLLDIFVW